MLHHLTVSIVRILMFSSYHVYETLWSDHSNETSLPVLTHGATCFSKFHKRKFEIFCRILPLAAFGSERGNTLLISH